MVDSVNTVRRPWWRRFLAIPVPALLPVVLLVGGAGGFELGRAWPATSAPAPVAETEAAPAPVADAAPTLDDTLLREVYGLVERDFYKPEDVDGQKLVWGAARGMVQALDDPNSVYESPLEREAGESRWTGRYEGVGMYVDQKDGKMIVTAPIDGGPAQKAGIRPGDVILKVDGQDITGKTLNRQTLQIRGPKGTVVVLTIQRVGQPMPFDLAITRDEVRIISSTSKMYGDVGVLRISQFTENSATETRTALNELLSQHPRRLVLDLRANAGGLLIPAVEVAGFFLGPGPVVQERRPTGEGKTYDAPENAALTDLPLLILVDKGTASASEVIAAAMRERGRAQLMGDQTYGKSTVQYINKLSDGSGLRITVAQWHTPQGVPIPTTGLVPDAPFPKLAVADPSPDQILQAVVQQQAAVPAGS